MKFVIKIFQKERIVLFALINVQRLEKGFLRLDMNVFQLMVVIIAGKTCIKAVLNNARKSVVNQESLDNNCGQLFA